MLIHVISLGCDKNRTDTETMLGLLAEAGHTITDDIYAAELFLINTCCFIGDAKEESVRTIIEVGQYKASPDYACRYIIMCGCLAQRYYDQIEDNMPEVDALLGTSAYDEIVSVVDTLIEQGGRPAYHDCIKPLSYLPDNSRQMVSTGGHIAYLKIAEGCSKRCTYCVIPNVRGDYRSYPMERLYAQAKRLAAGGVKELILVAQETDLYGIDLYGQKSLPALLKVLNEIEELRWIRILYCYPEEIDDALIAAIKENEKVVHYLDIPIQHASDAILKAMGRKTTKAGILANIQKLRREIPDIVLRTTLLTGFPGESRKDYAALSDFIQEIRFDRLGVFPYSREEDTPAYDMPHRVPEVVARRRRDLLMRTQRQISMELGEARIGEVMEVFVEGYIPDVDLFTGRTYADAPDVDGHVFFTAEDKNLQTGAFVHCLITDANDYDLIGEYYEPAE